MDKYTTIFMMVLLLVVALIAKFVHDDIVSAYAACILSLIYWIDYRLILLTEEVKKANKKQEVSYKLEL